MTNPTSHGPLDRREIDCVGAGPGLGHRIPDLIGLVQAASRNHKTQAVGLVGGLVPEPAALLRYQLRAYRDLVLGSVGNNATAFTHCAEARPVRQDTCRPSHDRQQRQYCLVSRGGLYAHGVRTEWLVVVVVCAGLALGSCDNETQPGSRQTSSPATPTASQSVTPPPVESSSAERDACEVVALRMPELRDGELGVWTGLSEFAAGGVAAMTLPERSCWALRWRSPTRRWTPQSEQLNVLKGAIAEATTRTSLWT